MKSHPRLRSTTKSIGFAKKTSATRETSAPTNNRNNKTWVVSSKYYAGLLSNTNPEKARFLSTDATENENFPPVNKLNNNQT